MKKAEKSKRAILEAAFKLALKKGISHMSMNDVVAAAEVSKGGLYHHFASRDDLLSDMLFYYVEQMTSSVHASLTPKTTTRRVLTLYREMMENMRDEEMSLFMEFVLLLRTNARLKKSMVMLIDHIYGSISDVIKRGIERGEVRPDLDAKKMGYIFGIAMDGYAMGRMVVPDLFDKMNLGKFMMDQFWRIIRSGSR
jgi:AcrR family transcriptional regulator